MRDPYFDNEEVQHLYDSSGFWIAFRIGSNVFDTVGNWVGWLPFDKTEVHSPRGSYLGHIYPDNRFYRKPSFLKRESIDTPAPPRYTPAQQFPGNIPRAQLPIGAQDLRLSAHV